MPCLPLAGLMEYELVGFFLFVFWGGILNTFRSLKVTITYGSFSEICRQKYEAKKTKARIPLSFPLLEPLNSGEKNNLDTN